MIEKISVQKAIELKNKVFIDVRSPSEFEQDHIMGAVNLPILTNEERHEVGIIYKQISKEQAINKGKGYYEQKIPEMKKFVEQFKGKTLIVYCWRGGMRSEVITTLFSSLGYESYQLKGGYKSYRAEVLEQLNNFKFKNKLYVLHGLTCSGKTALLHKLPNAIDLEGLAQHRGSLYGAIGLKPRTQKMFDNLLLQELDKLDPNKPVFIEGESRRIGDLMIPESLWKEMKKGINVYVERDLQIRVKETVKEYFNNEQMIKEIENVSKSLWKVISKKKKEQLLEFLRNKEFEKAAEILLVEYYDPLYKHSLNKLDYSFTVNCNNVDECVKEIMKNI